MAAGIMADETKLYPASASHPDYGDDSIDGSLSVQVRLLKFECETGVLEMPYEGLVVECEEDVKGQVFFRHQDCPGWVVCALSQELLSRTPFQTKNNLVRQLRDVRERQDGRQRLKVTVRFLVGFVVVALLGMFLSGFIMNRVVDRVPMEFETKIAAKLSKKIEKQVHLVDNPALSNQLAGVIQKLMMTQPPVRYQPRVFIYRSPIDNAFIIPGGYYYISTALLDQADSTEEVAGVLAHETAHLLCRHGVRQIMAQNGHSFLFRWIFGEKQSLLAVISEGSDILLHLTYSRECEWEADNMGWKLLLAANIDPSGELRMLRKIGDSTARFKGGVSDEKDIFSTHPMMQDRIDNLDRKWEQSTRKSGFTRLDKLEWNKEKPEEPKDSVDELLKE
jgi:Zn-dependent protease with chaperone function